MQAFSLIFLPQPFAVAIRFKINRLPNMAMPEAIVPCTALGLDVCLSVGREVKMEIPVECCQWMD
jgi:hypothetical protein